MHSAITVREDGPVAYVSLNRPQVSNALSARMLDELAQAARDLDARSHIKVVVLRAEGPSFCAGFDLAEFSSLAGPAEARAIVDAGRRMAQAVAAMRPITIAAVQGHCVGGGVVLMMACDFRYAATSARFRLPEAELGFPLAWGGAAWLTREVGPLMATELILTCKELSGAEAHLHGLVNDAVPPSQLDPVAQSMAQRLSACSALVLETTKAQISAAKRALCSDDHAYMDSHALHSALTDPQSQLVRDRYLTRRAARDDHPKPLA